LAIREGRRRYGDGDVYNVCMGSCTCAYVDMGDWKEYESVYMYIVERKYADGCSKVEKRRIREKAQAFVVNDAILYHKNQDNVLCRVVVDDAEKTRILSSLHAGAIGGAHYGQNGTIKKVSDRFWWRNVANDARNFVRACTVCQKCN